MRILAVPGSLRAGSSNLALLRAAAAVAPDGMEWVFYDGVGTLPHFNPDLDTTPPPAAVDALRAARETATHDRTTSDSPTRSRRGTGPRH